MEKTGYKKFVISILVLIIFFLLYAKYYKKEEIEKPVTSKVEEEVFTNSNQIKDIKYSSKDLKGNEYILLAKEGEIDLNNSDIIFLKDELIDIYGPIPDYLDNLLSLTNLKLDLKDRNIKYIKIIDDIIKIEFKNKDLIKINNIVNLTKDMDLKIMKNNMVQLKIDAINFDSLCVKAAEVICMF